MSIFDPKTGFRRQLNYDEALNQAQKENIDAGKKGGPGINREATRFVQSPFFERLKDSVYEDLQKQQVIQTLVQTNDANLRRAAADTGLPPDFVRHIPGPPGPPGERGPPGPEGAQGPAGGAGGGSAFGGGPFDSSGAGSAQRERRRSRRSNPTGTQEGMDVDQPPPSAGAAAATVSVGTSAPAGITPAVQAEVNQARLEAELRKLAEERDIANRRADVAQGVSEQLRAQRVNNPIFIASNAFGSGQSPPPAPVATPAPTVKPEDVVKAVKAAMQGERRTLQEMMAHHGASMREVIQNATSSSARSVPTPHEAPQVTPMDTGVTVPGRVKKMAAQLEATSTKRPKSAKRGSEAAMATSSREVPYPVPISQPRVFQPSPPPPLPTNVAQNSSLLNAPAAPRTQASKRKGRDDLDDLEDIYAFERNRPNPSGALQKATKKRTREDLLTKRPLLLGPDPLPGNKKRPRDGGQGGRAGKPANPAPRNQGVKQAAKTLMDALYRASIPRLTFSKAEAAEILTRDPKQPIRLDQFDRKRSYDDIVGDIDQMLTRKRRGVMVPRAV